MSSNPHDDGQATVISPDAPKATERSLRTFLLRVVAGPDVGKTLLVDPRRAGRVLLGQGPACTLQLDDRAVSRRHAAIDPEEGVLHLYDLTSTNGTFVNGLRAFDVMLNGGETVQLGSTVVRVEPGEDVSEPTSDQSHFGTFMGSSDEIRRLYPLIDRIAASEIPVVIEGETGTGKEVLAESLHEAGPRANGPFVVFDCTTVAANLMEATLFGHERGSFTGALTSAPGLFEQAHGGTLFIDEIGDLDIALQAKLLRAIERSEVRRIGGRGWTRVDVRVIAATRRDLDREVQTGRFRDDLFFRLAVARVELPPLRRRRKDIALLAAYFWQQMGGTPSALTGDLLKRLEDYDWPGNVRELRNAVAQRIALGDLASQSRPSVGGPPGPTSGDALADIIAKDLPFPIAREKAMELFEERYVQHVLALNGGNVTRAAHAAGIGRRYFQRIRERRKE
jgi:two-component system, NtrC family, response regulator HydG